MQKIAILSDIHLHDIYFGYGLFEAYNGDLGLRSLKDSLASTRVFNESIAALNNALEDIQKRGIKHVILLGDLTDDGQPPNYQALKIILNKMSKHYNIQFFALFGNHDCFGNQGKPLEKWLIKASSHMSNHRGEFKGVHVTGINNPDGHAIYSADMVCSTQSQALEFTKQWGMSENSHSIYRETPQNWLQAAGISDKDDSFLASDSSYLVEIAGDIWLLLLDGNIVRQDKTGRYILHANAAWQKVLDYRPYMEDWLSDVAKRAKDSGKVLLAFSHYPMVGFPCLNKNEHDKIGQLAGGASWAKRMPALSYSERLANTGIHYHFSGHMHALGHSQYKTLHNYAMPSSVSFPAAYGLITIEGEKINIEAVSLQNVRDFEIAFPVYENERNSNFNGDDFKGDYQAFLLASMRHLIDHKYLKRDWSHSLIELKEQSLSTFIVPSSAFYQTIPPNLTLYQCLSDYYLLLFGCYLAFPYIDEQNLDFYCALPSPFRAADCLVNEPDFILLMDFLRMLSQQAKAFPHSNPSFST